MIDCLYNVTAILEDPARVGPLYRKGGLRKRLEAIREDEARYGGKAEWDEFNAKRREKLRRLILINGFTEEEIEKAQSWKTLGQYLRAKTLTPHQQFLKTFTYLQWRKYSALSHAGFEAEKQGAATQVRSTAPYYSMTVGTC